MLTFNVVCDIMIMKFDNEQHMLLSWALKGDALYGCAFCPSDDENKEYI